MSATCRKKKQCTEVQNIEFINKQQCQFFVFTFISPQFKFTFHPCVVNQSFLLDSFKNINLQLLLLLKWRVHDTCIPFPSIYLFPYFRSISSRTRTFFISLEGSNYRESTVFLDPNFHNDWKTTHTVLMGWKLCPVRVLSVEMIWQGHPTRI